MSRTKDLKCPVSGCGYSTTQIEKDLFKCRNPKCGHEFRDVPTTRKEVDVTRKNINRHEGQVQVEDGNTYTCLECNGVHHIVNKSRYSCKDCGGPICSDCYGEMETKKCTVCHRRAIERHNEEVEKENATFILFVIGAIILFLFGYM